MDRDLIDTLKQGRVASAGAAATTYGLLPVVRATSVAGTSIDTQGFHSAMATFNIGVFGDVQSGTVFTEAELQVCNDNATWIPAADADLLFPPGDAPRTGVGTGGCTAASGCFFNSKTTGAVDLSGTYSVGYLGTYRYLRVNVRLTSPTTGSPVSVVMTAGHPDYSPVTGNPS